MVRYCGAFMAPTTILASAWPAPRKRVWPAKRPQARNPVVAKLKQEMATAVREERFEEAAKLRDQIKALEEAKKQKEGEGNA